MKNDIADKKIREIKEQHLFDRETGKEPKYNKGKHIPDWYTCGNCGCGLHYITDNWCWNCGYKILWDNPRCLTKYKESEKAVKQTTISVKPHVNKQIDGQLILF